MRTDATKLGELSETTYELADTLSPKDDLQA